MHIARRGAWIVLGLVLAGVVAGGPSGCGSKEDRAERGLVVNDENAVPESNKYEDMTEAQRRAREEHALEKKEAEEFNESQP
jgi:hypothetical protein